jgi:hypothetical protein
MHLIGNKKERNKISSGSNIIEIDATFTENISASVTTSSYRKESGVLISDHVQSEPIVVKIQGVISYTTDIVNYTGNPIDDANNKWAKLLQFVGYDASGNCLTPKILTVESGTNVFTNMCPTSLETTVDNKRGIYFTIGFVKFQYGKVGSAVGTKTLDTTNADPVLKHILEAQKDSGNQTVKPAKPVSVLSWASDFGKNLRDEDKRFASVANDKTLYTQADIQKLIGKKYFTNPLNKQR